MSILKIKDSQGNWVGVPTVKGDTGNGISSTTLNDDYTLTLSFTDGTTYTTPSIRGEKGEQGDPATSMEIHICSASEYDAETRIPTIANPNDKTFYLVPTEDGTSPDLFTEWVYVNNAWEMFGSAKIDLSNYVTNTDYATLNQGGVVKVGGLGIIITNGEIQILPASSSQIKRGSGNTAPINASKEHEATFYGLAKAAGDTTQSSSSNAVGEYTDSAKTAIKNMLGVIDGGGTISETITGTDPTITAQNNFRYMCGELYTLNFTPCVSGVCEVIFTSGATPTVLTLPDTVRMPTWWTGVEANTTYEISIVDGVYGAVMSWS